MSIRFATGFEHGNLAQATDNVIGTVAIMSSDKRTGDWCIQCNPTTTNTGYFEPGQVTSTGARSTNIGQFSTGMIAFGFKCASSLPSTGEIILRVEDNLGNWIHLHLASDGTLDVISSAGGTIASGTAALSADTWYFIEFGFEKTSSGGGLTVKIDGTTDISGTSLTTTQNGWRRTKLGKATNTNGDTVDFRYDDVFFEDSYTFYTDADSYGAVKLTVTGDGNYTAWTAGTGSSNYLEVDEVSGTATVDGADYVMSSGTSGDKSTFALSDLSDVDTILCAIAWCYTREDTSVASAQNVMIRSSTTDDFNNDFNGGTSHTWLARIAETDPATAAAWTQSGINAMEVGMRDNSAGQSIRCAGVFAEVFYSVAAPGGLSIPIAAYHYNHNVGSRL